MLSDAQWAELEPLVEGRAARRARPRRRSCGARCRRSCGVTITVPGVAGDPAGVGALVAGRADLYPLSARGRVGAPVELGAGSRRTAWHGVPRRHQHPCAPESRRCHAERGASGRAIYTRSAWPLSWRLWDKACVTADGAGRAIAFRIAPGQAHELPYAIPLLDRLPGVPKWVVGDRGHSSHGFREYVWDSGARPAIPFKRSEAPVACPDWISNNRNTVERVCAKLKKWRAVATRYEKTTSSFIGFLSLAATIDWIKRRQALGRMDRPESTDAARLASLLLISSPFRF